jgi:hypothetical protein
MGSAFALGLQRADERREERQKLEADQRNATLKALQEDATTPQDKVDAIQSVYHKDPSVLKQHVENLTARMTGRKPKPVVSPQQAEAARIAPIAARGQTPDQKASELYQTELAAQAAQQGKLAAAKQEQEQKAQVANLATYKQMVAAAKTPEEKKLIDSFFGIKDAPHYQNVRMSDGTIAAVDVNQGLPPGATLASTSAGTPPKPVFKILKGHEVLIDPASQKVIKDFGPTGTARVTTHQQAITDGNGQVHIVNLTSVSTPGGGSVDVDVDPSQSEAPKGPAPRSAPKSHPASSGTNGSKTLDFTKGTPASNKARTDYVEASKLSSIADQVAQHPNDAINQKRLAVALERASAGRFTTQALDYIIKSGWGNTIEQWANNPTTGALPADVMRQLVDGAHQNLTAARQAITDIDSLGKTPAPKADSKGGKSLADRLNEALQ